jgi:stearoyl-CoA 9-desaturase NADPH oxidoreductase
MGSRVAERGAAPTVPAGRRRALELLRSFTSPLAPDDYLELINPLWSTRELRGRVEAVQRHTAPAVTIVIKPGWEWPGHRPGQYVRLGVEVDGVHHWRAYSLTSDPARADGYIAITPKLVESGKVSPFLHAGLERGAIVRLGGVEGSFVLPDPLPRRLLFISAGSGITPIMSMLRSLSARASLGDALHVHSERCSEAVIFASELHALARKHSGYRLHEQISGQQGRVTPARLEHLCPDWRERETFLCGPAGLISALRERWESDGDPERLHTEHFQPDEQLGSAEHGSGGAIRFARSGIEAKSDGTQPILVAGESAGARLEHGCRMGICHSCVGTLRCGRVRDLRTGRVHGQPGESLRICINAPEGDVEIDL